MGCSCSKNAALEPCRPGLPALLGAVPKHNEPSDPKGKKAQEKAQKAERAVEVSCHASAGAKWHLELLAVSAELKEKLQDPQFVATRCDLDGSGDLDAHELKQAARVYGISQSGSSENHDGCTNPRLMAGQRVSKESFAEMVASQGSTKLRAFDSNRVKVLLGGTCPQNALTISTRISILDQFRSDLFLIQQNLSIGDLLNASYLLFYFVQRLFSGSISESVWIYSDAKHEDVKGGSECLDMSCWYPWSMTLQAFPGRLIHVDAPESVERWTV